MVSIEFFHIYTDEPIDQEKIDSIYTIKKVIKKLNSEYSTCILIDDYTPEAKSLTKYKIISNASTVKQFITTHNIKVNNIIYESYLISLYTKVLSDIHYQDAKKYKRLIEKNQKIPCSLFVIIWYLLRLGVYDLKTYVLPKADQLLNILPMRFKEIDDIVFKILLRSKYKDLVPNIKSIYFESDNTFRPKI